MMKRYFTGLLVFALAIGTTVAQDKNLPKETYLASGIPDALKTDANAVVRYSAEELAIKGPGKATIKSHTITTVLNDKADDVGRFVLFYHRKFNNYSNIEIKIYSATGQLIKKYHRSDMYDRAASNDETIVTDDRVLLLQHKFPTYPTTVEVIAEENISSYTSLGSWMIRTDADVAVQSSSYKVTVDPTAGFRYQAVNIQTEPKKESVGGMDVYRWEVKDLKASTPEGHLPSWNVHQKVNFATTDFEFYGSKGSFDSWQNFGSWIGTLNGDANVLPPARVAEIKKMTDTIKTDKAKAKFLYNYMQQNVRYVSVQLGIGGLKPFPATYVDQRKYGDCKALSNYMNALLKAVDIPSYYAIINAGPNAKPADPQFPSNVFNHVILCIPLKGDTTWLECTSTTQPFGKLGTFTENRRALLITENGGKLVNTPKSTIEDNVFDSYTQLTLKPDGSASAKVRFVSKGEYRSLFLGMEAAKMDERKEYLLRSMNIKQPLIFNIKPAADKDGVKELDIDLVFDRFYDMMAGDKQFYKPAVLDIWQGTLPEVEKRNNDYYFEHPMQKQSLTTIDLPEGYEVESIPADVKLKFSYGNYDVNYQYDKAKNQVTAKAVFKLTDHVIPAAKYTEMQQYMEEIARSQSKKMVIKRKA